MEGGMMDGWGKWVDGEWTVMTERVGEMDTGMDG